MFMAQTAKLVEIVPGGRQGHILKWMVNAILMVSCQKGPTRHAYAWQIGPFWQDTLDIMCWSLGARSQGTNNYGIDLP